MTDDKDRLEKMRAAAHASGDPKLIEAMTMRAHAFNAEKAVREVFGLADVPDEEKLTKAEGERALRQMFGLNPGLTGWRLGMVARTEMVQRVRDALSVHTREEIAEVNKRLQAAGRVPRPELEAEMTDLWTRMWVGCMTRAVLEALPRPSEADISAMIEDFYVRLEAAMHEEAMAAMAPSDDQGQGRDVSWGYER